MIETVSKVGPFLNRTKWFTRGPALFDSLRFVRYAQAENRQFCPGFVRQVFQTKVIDLTCDEDSIFNQMRKTTRYKIKRAQREGVTCGFDGVPATFRAVYDQIAIDQGRRPIPKGHIETAADGACISYASHDGIILVMHCTLLDRQSRRARLWYSCSRFAGEESSEMANLVGRANRLLHYKDILHFKNEGFAIYDLGGYSSDETDQKKMAINKFKDGFGGSLLVEANYVSYPLFLAQQGVRLIARRNRLSGDRRSGMAASE